MQVRRDRLSRTLIEATESLSVDLVTAEVARALSERGIRAILLKGPSFARWLYADGELRPYGDSDLLVAPDDVRAAQEVLLALGFRYGYESLGPEALGDGLGWVRGAHVVDLHTSVRGIGVPPQRVWELLSKDTEPQTVAGTQLAVLAAPARALHVALHAAQHGRLKGTPMEDLERALEQLPLETWEQTARLAADLDATAAFATGLSLAPVGEQLTSRLGLEPDSSVNALLRAATAPPLALGLEELRMTQGVRAKFAYVTRKLFPSRTYMRFISPLARRGRGGLLLAYVRRLGWLIAKIGPALRAWRRARRESR